MKIKSIEITGFKSFYERTPVGFQDAVNSVVGPNGCGKSNILDAIRWAIGEQNPRRLRAGSMEEVISNGGETLKPLGMAEVSLVLLNVPVPSRSFSEEQAGNQPRPNDIAANGFDEVRIKRRLFRSGESEYYINGVASRLKDITEMFMDTGSGARSYSIVDQGKVERLITAKPEENRALIEEVAGVVRYKARRRETESHIDSTKENLTRVKDVLNEVNRRMSALARQAGDADEFKRLSEEGRRTELKILYSRLYEAKEKGKNLLDEKTELESRISSVEESVRDKENVLENMESDVLRLEQKLERMKKEVYETGSDLRSKEAARETLRSEVSRLDEFIVRLEKETDLLREEDKKIEIQVDFKGKALEERISDLSSKEFELGEKEEIASRLKAGSAQGQSELDAARKNLFETLDEHNSLKAVAYGYEKELNEFRSRRERTRKEFAEVKIEGEKILSGLSEIEGILKGVKEIRSRAEEGKKYVESRLAELNAHLELKKKEAELSAERHRQAASRLGVLKQIEANYEWLPEGIRNFILERKGYGILGVVADFVSAPKGYEKALEAALGEKLRWAVVKEDEEALKSVDSLKGLSIGRGTFISMDAVKQNGDFRKSGNGIAALLDVIMLKNIGSTTAPSLSNVIENMLNGVFVVPSLREAVSLRDKVEAGASFVTLEGDLLDSGGAISGGFAGEGVFLRKREMEELTDAVHEIEREIAGISDEIELNAAEIRKIRGALEETGKELVETEIKEAGINKDISNMRDNLAKTRRRYEMIELDLTGIESEIREREMELNVNVSTLKQLESEKELLEKEFAELKGRLQEWEEDQKRLEKQITDLKIETATLVEKQKGFQEDLNELRERRKKIKERSELEVREIAEKSEEKLGLLKTDEDNKKSIEGILEILAAKEKELSVENGEKDNLLHRIGNTREEKEALSKETAKLREGLNKLHLDLNSLGVETRHIEDGIQESSRLAGGADYTEVFGIHSLQNFNRSDEESKLKKIREKIEKLGAVNLLAPEEYKSLEERSKFLSEQMEDLVNALSSLKKAMSRIDRESARRFNETFEVVNKRFQEIFRRLFKGGEAKLVLTDAEDILETGVQIMVRPKGKKFQPINLLSGGEKSLSAIALVLSACLVRPAPFLLFDEIDANLDDVNTGQFAELLKEIAKESQVIIITHNKKTMQAADSLIGITSDRPGISKVVSVELRGS